MLLRLAAAPAASLTDVPEVDPDASDPADILTAVRLLASDPQLREAISIASPSLHGSLDKACAADEPVEPARLRRLLVATMRYALRLHHRPTPFGTFAGVSTATLGSPPRARVGDDHRQHASLDQGWVAHQRAAAPSGTVVAEPLLARHGDRVTNPSAPDGQVSVAASPLLEKVLERARSPRPVDELATLVRQLVPDADLPQARVYLDGLRSTGLLLDGARPTRALPDAAQTAHTADQDQRPLHVDLQMDAHLTIPPAVAREAATAAKALWRLASDVPASADLDAYHQRFLHRYGTERLIPVIELLDSHRGLGPPDGYRHPASARPAPTAPALEHPVERDELLADLTPPGLTELALDSDLVAALSNPSDRLPPRTFDLGVSVHADSAQTMAAGDFLLACTNGSVTGGATIGRFASMLGVETDLRRLTDRGQAEVVAELLAPTPDPRQANVTPPTGALPATLEVGLAASEEPPGRIDIRDVAVGSTGHTLYAVDTRQHRVLDPVRLNMVNPTTALPNAARLLSALALGGRKMWGPWDWGRLSVLPHRPRVRLGHVILAPQRWRAPARLTAATEDPPRFTAELAKWLEGQEVPTQVRVADGDQRLDLDLDHPLHRTLLRDHLRQRPATQVEESPHGWCAAHGIADPHGLMSGHACELVLPIRTPGHADPIGPPRVPYASLTTSTVRHLPGGPWVSAKVYAAAEAHDRLIATGLGGLMDRLGPETFLLRYADPDPHLRIRVPDPGREALAAVHDWSVDATASALVRTVVHDEYAPEVDRYGGPQAMPAAEVVFARDSTLVRRILSDRNLPDVAGGRPTIAAASCLDLLEAFAGDDVTSWLLEVLPPALAHAVPTRTRRAAQPVVLGNFAGIAGEPVAVAVADRRRAAAEHGCIVGPPSGGGHSAALSLMHLHCNRLLGLSQAQEHTAYGILRSAVSARAGRRAALR